MKKLIYLPAILLVLTACGGASTEQVAADSARQADSIAAMEKAAEQQALAAEQARQDSLRQDSIAKANAFVNKLPNPKTLLSKNHKARGSYLSGLGFKGSTKVTGDEWEGESSTGNYSLTGANGQKCTVKWSCEFNTDDVYITITGDENALNDFFINAQKLRSRGLESGTEISRKGNTITISWFGA